MLLRPLKSILNIILKKFNKELETCFINSLKTKKKSTEYKEYLERVFRTNSLETILVLFIWILIGRFSLVHIILVELIL